ncbi:hypothetical protein TNCV_946101 [Trichonephila clavipes]|nr:hypothetical protein TNCV_946101 [Trichonephila clavipes]
MVELSVALRFSTFQQLKKYLTVLIKLITSNCRAMGSLVVRASDNRPEGLGSMPDATKYPLSTRGYVLIKSVGPKVLWAESRVQGTGEYFPPL